MSAKHPAGKYIPEGPKSKMLLVLTAVQVNVAKIVSEVDVPFRNESTPAVPPLRIETEKTLHGLPLNPTAASAEIKVVPP